MKETKRPLRVTLVDEMPLDVVIRRELRLEETRKETVAWDKMDTVDIENLADLLAECAR